MDEDTEEYTRLCERVREIDESAFEYMVIEAYKLSSFRSGGSLMRCFTWHYTPQGHDYWRNIRIKLEEDYHEGRYYS